MQRSTADLIALLLAIVVAVVVTLTTLAILFTYVTHPEQDVTEPADAIGRIVAVLVGVLAGYIAGRKMNGYH